MDLALELLESLRMYLGATVQEAAFVIWPRDTWPEDTDTKLYLKLLLSDKSIVHFVMDTDTNGQTPRFTQDEYKPKYSYSQLGERLAAWKADAGDDHPLSEAEIQQWCDTHVSLELEVFDLAGSTEYGWLIDSRLVAIELVCYLDYHAPGGTILHFDNGRYIWSHPGTDGNTIWLEYDRKYMADDWRFYKIRLDLDCRSEDDCKLDRLASADL